jgi:uncharacterized protein YwqG
MEIRRTKAHLEFDLEASKKTYATLKKGLCGERITSCYDLYAVERLRDEHGLRDGAAVPTDVFVFGKGAPPERWMTKVSGLPYWPATKAWPTAADGSHLQFLAQFCFADSKDLIPSLPGEILLMFVPQGEAEWLWEPDQIRFEWMTRTKTALVEILPTGVQAYCQSEWYGVLHRTFDYPSATGRAEELELDEHWNVPVLNGSKIGGVPHAVQQDDDRTKEVADRLFLCQLSSIQPAPQVAYPWTNQKKKLSLSFDEEGIYGEGNQCVFGDMGSIYVFLEPSGVCVATTGSY